MCFNISAPWKCLHIDQIVDHIDFQCTIMLFIVFPFGQSIKPEALQVSKQNILIKSLHCIQLDGGISVFIYVKISNTTDVHDVHTWPVTDYYLIQLECVQRCLFIQEVCHKWVHTFLLFS